MPEFKPLHANASGDFSPFERPKFSVKPSAEYIPSTLRTLPSLAEFNSYSNPSHLFCLQYGHNVQQPPRRITHKELYDAVLRCSVWLEQNGLAQYPKVAGGRLHKARPVALLMASDVNWFICFLALLRFDVPVLCMSARLSPQAVVHLVGKTGAQAILASPQLETLIEESNSLFASNDSVEAPTFIRVPHYTEFVDESNKFNINSAPNASTLFDNNERTAVILHSSGTTGLPKPIFHTHAYLLGYAACHQLSPDDVIGAMNVSTLPLFHGFGLLAPSLSLSIGLPFAIPASTTIPTGSSTFEVLKSAHATSLLTVPSILEEIYLLEDGAGIEALRYLKFVAVGGAPMKHSVAEPLADAGVPILNHWGVTELGALVPVIVPGEDYDWHYLSLRDDIDVKMAPIADGYHQISGYAPGTTELFVVQDLLLVNPNKPTTEFRIAGRADDLVVLATGEKVRPNLLEQSVSEHPLVKGAVAFGDGKFQLGLLLEAAPHVTLDISNAQAVSAYIDQVWPAVERGNEMTDHHGRVTREMIIVTTPATRELLRTPKGSIPRNSNVELFKQAVEDVYARADMAGAEPIPYQDPTQLLNFIREVVQGSFNTPRKIGDEDDFFERGMDSLKATILRKRLAASAALTLAGSLEPKKPLPQNFVYANPTILRLSIALAGYLGSGGASSQDRIGEIKQVADEYIRSVSTLRAAPTTNGGVASDSTVAVLTGSTGSLGSAILSELVFNPAVSKVYALNRGDSQSLRERQESGLRKLNVDLGDAWSKVELIGADLGARQFGLDDATYSDLRNASHIIHNAWPMDFNRSLTSFRPHLDASRNIIQLALDSRSPNPTKVLFSSSIAVIGRVPIVSGNPDSIKEVPLEDPEAIDHFGYAEAKWVCEKIFEEAGRSFAGKLVASTVRIGQMTGCEATGAWNTAEHFPMIIKSCKALGRLPIIEGDASWIPVNRAAQVMTELLFAQTSSRTLHMENPSRQSWSDILKVFSEALDLPLESAVPFDDWVARVKSETDASINPCVKIVPFLEEEFVRMATGEVVLDTTETKELSPTLAASGPLGKEHLLGYLQYWRSQKFIA